MAVDLPEVHAQALAHTRTLVAGVGPAQWDAASVCSDWDVRALVNHLVSGNLWVPPLVEGRSVSVSVAREAGTIMEAARRLDQAGLNADDVAIRRPTLDDVFLTLTGRELSAETDGQTDIDHEEVAA